MPANDAQRIVTINLKYGTSAKPLKTLAFGQLTAKVLFVAGEPLSTKAVGAWMAEAIGVKGLSDDLVVAGLKFLEETGRARERNGTWALSDGASAAIAKDVRSAEERLTGVLSRHFPGGIDAAKLRAWFHDASAELFGHYGDDWVASVCGKGDTIGRYASLTELLRPSIVKHGLQAHADPLASGFVQFVSSSDISDRQHLMGLGQAMFSARLVAADVGVDPFTIEEFRSCTIILDTNLLFVMALEGHRLASAVVALAKALKGIEAKIKYIRPSKEEYGRALAGKRGMLLNLLDTYPEELIAETRDDFVGTARARHCKSIDDYREFFDALIDLPEHAGDGVTVSLHEDDHIAAAIEKARADNPLKQLIQQLVVELRPIWRRKKKSEPSLSHDAALIHVTEAERQLGERCWVLSLDKTLQACAVRRAGPHQMPTVISVDALIEILAVNSGGPGADASEFAPLLAQMILNQCEPPENTYTLDDLQLLSGINEQVAELPPDAAKSIVLLIAKARVQGIPPGDTQLQLNVNRMYQVRRVERDQQLKDAASRAQYAEAVAGQERGKRESREAELIELKVREYKRTAVVSFLKDLSWRLVAAAVGAGGLWVLGRSIVPKGSYAEAINYAIAISGLVILLGGMVWKPVQQLVETRKSALRRATIEVRGSEGGSA